jgi:chorismate mutase
MEQEILKLGIAGLICIVLVWVNLKSEKREEKKDMRIQLLENQLMESLSERIEAVEQIANALHSNSVALTALTNEIRSKDV